MATSNRGMLSNYTQLNTIPALTGILFATGAAVQFLGASITIAPAADMSYTFEASHALLVSLVTLVIAFASSDTKDWRYYETYEQATVGVAALFMVGAEYLVEISDLITNNEPTMGIVAFVVSMAAWGVLAR